MAAGHYIDDDGDEYDATEEQIAELERQERIEFCQECSSTFSARAVYHLTPEGYDASAAAGSIAALIADASPISDDERSNGPRR